MNTSSLQIIHTNDYQEALSYTQRGYEPIECAFGGFGSVLGPLCMDHHGTESWREGVAIRACRDHYGERKTAPHFVTTGTADADAVLAIVALAGLVPQEDIPQAFYQLVNAYDLDPIGIELIEEPFGLELLHFQQTPDMYRNADSFHKGIRVMHRILTQGLSPQKKAKINKKERNRILLAEQGIVEHSGEQVLFVSANVWGFDRWYKKASVVVSYSSRYNSITMGCPNAQIAEDIFGPGGLMNVFKMLGQGWGGRASVGGSPRGQKLSLEEAQAVARKVADFISQLTQTQKEET